MRHNIFGKRAKRCFPHGGGILNCLSCYVYDARWTTIRVPNKSKIKEGERFFMLATSFGSRTQGRQRHSESLHPNGSREMGHRREVAAPHPYDAQKIDW